MFMYVIGKSTLCTAQCPLDISNQLTKEIFKCHSDLKKSNLDKDRGKKMVKLNTLFVAPWKGFELTKDL